MERPIFVLGCGWRTGSTLLQRLLCSHPEVHIWGENRGIVSDLQHALQTIAGLERVSEKHRAEFEKHGSGGWIAMLNPPSEGFRSGLRMLLESYYRDPARELGKERWGFKEVRYDMSAVRFLRDLYPDSKFLLIVRHPADSLASARATQTMLLKKGLLAEIGGVEAFLRHWARLGSSFLESGDDPCLLTLRYEEMTSSPSDAIGRVAEFLSLQPAGFDRTVFDVRRRGWLEREPRLTAEDLESLRAEWLWSIARRYGYAPRGIDD